MIQARFRKDYDGEFVLTKTTFKGGKKTEAREWMPNPIINQHISGRAAVIGSSVDQQQFNYPILQSHRGGLLGSKKLQTYGTGDVWKNMRLDFYVTTNTSIIPEVKDANYNESTPLYTNTSNALKNPGHFYIVPFSPVLDDLALALYLAAFDGHKEIYMLGYTNDTVADNSNWITNVNTVIQTYADVTFYPVGVEPNIPKYWRYHKNVKCLDYRSFVSFADV